MNIETFAVDVTGALWNLPIGWIAMCASIIMFVANIGFALGVLLDAIRLPASRKPIFVGSILWFLATLVGGVFVAGIYWIMHHSQLNQSLPAPPPED